jgi:hypothetical protein
MKTGEVVFNMPVAIANIEIGNVPCMGLNRDSITNSFGKEGLEGGILFPFPSPNFD